VLFVFTCFNLKFKDQNSKLSRTTLEKPLKQIVFRGDSTRLKPQPTNKPKCKTYSAHEELFPKHKRIPPPDLMRQAAEESGIIPYLRQHQAEIKISKYLEEHSTTPNSNADDVDPLFDDLLDLERERDEQRNKDEADRTEMINTRHPEVNYKDDVALWQAIEARENIDVTLLDVILYDENPADQLEDTIRSLWDSESGAESVTYPTDQQVAPTVVSSVNLSSHLLHVDPVKKSAENESKGKGRGKCSSVPIGKNKPATKEASASGFISDSSTSVEPNRSNTTIELQIAGEICVHTVPDYEVGGTIHAENQLHRPVAPENSSVSYTDEQYQPDQADDDTVPYEDSDHCLDQSPNSICRGSSRKRKK